MRLNLISTIVIVLCSVCILINSAHAYDEGTVSEAAVLAGSCEKIGPDQKKVVIDMEKQIGLLEMQNSLLKEHNQRLLTTVHWALGFAALFLLAVLGLISYFTYRRYEQETKSLKTLLAGEVQKARTEFEGRLSEWESKSKDKMQEQIKSLAQSQNKIARSAANTAVEPLGDRIKSLQRDFTYHHIDLLKLEAWKFRKQGNTNGAILCLYRAAKKAWFELKSEFIVSNTLEEIKSILDKGGKVVATTAMPEIHAFLQSLPPEFEYLVKPILSKL